MKLFVLSFSPWYVHVQSLLSLMLILEGSLFPAQNYGDGMDMGSQTSGWGKMTCPQILQYLKYEKIFFLNGC